MFVAVDLGNTALKLGAFEGDRLVATERIDVPRSLAEDAIPPVHLVAADQVAVLASSPRRAAEFRAWSPRDARILGDEVRGDLATSYDRPTDLGLDRLAAAVGARALVGRLPLVVVDAGTAITVDALDADGRLLAIAIAPGLRPAAAGLRAAAPHLPSAPLAPGGVDLPARGTDASLRTGLVLGTAGLVDRLVAAARSVAGAGATVVLTGGDAELLAPHLAAAPRTEPHAVLHGILALARRRGP